MQGRYCLAASTDQLADGVGEMFLTEIGSGKRIGGLPAVGVSLAGDIFDRPARQIESRKIHLLR
jgi:hypothetical protein